MSWILSTHMDVQSVSNEQCGGLFPFVAVTNNEQRKEAEISALVQSNQIGGLSAVISDRLAVLPVI